MTTARQRLLVYGLGGLATVVASVLPALVVNVAVGVLTMLVVAAVLDWREARRRA